MKKYRFSYAQRYALWRAYDMKCFYCDCPLDFQNLTIDHVLPESLLADSTKLTNLLSEYEIIDSYPDFSINDYTNWVPTDGPSCNYRKGSEIFSKTFTLFLLNRIQNRIPVVIRELSRLLRTRDVTKALGEVSTALEKGSISQSQIISLLNEIEFERTSDEPLIISFGMNIPEALNIDGVLSYLKDLNYVILCDRLENDLVEFLRTTTNEPFHYAESSSRDGETLGIRLVFPLINSHEEIDLSGFELTMPWWQIMEVSNFFRVYGVKYREVFGD